MNISKAYTNRRGPVVSVEAQKNLLGEDMFRQVTFADGSYVTFSQDVMGKWTRHRGGGRYGSRRNYEG